MFGGTRELTQWVKALPQLPFVIDDDHNRIAAITLLEHLKSVAAAMQAQLTADFANSVHDDGAARNQDRDQLERRVAGEIALARQESPVAGRAHLNLARALTTALPQT